MAYADHSSSTHATSLDNGASPLHPCSDDGQATDPKPFIADEMLQTDTKTIGLFRPPLDYIPGSTGWNWHEDGWQSAFSAALSQKGIEMTADQIEIAYNNIADPQSSLLYDPVDRNTAVFQDEPAASLMARYGIEDRKFSLIIICPYVRADGVDWERIYDTMNRPPIYSRWSTGAQAVHEPIVLMCLPRLETKTGRESYNKTVDWFSVNPRPNTTFSDDFDLLSKELSSEDIDEYMDTFNFPTQLGFRQSAFRQALVRIHRMIALGLFVHDDDLPAWIEQYGEHLLELEKHDMDDDPPVFKFDEDEPFQGGDETITYRTITALILNPSFEAANAAEEWDEAIENYVTWCLEPDDELAKEAFETFAKQLEFAAGERY
ncbi:uncharacterized protein J4E78_004546 [Alternaria triticimaculans]|uniref:uncharacterized protein n=1 Tax=Alternaria triticimaculans TaxID=297637 RepID=UPI0020C2AFC3|nr:uncharacterized protein J4E78_004546 [Alternaria triticimaculans]KAI4661756.1 hypothetical protein J4E78_004546 [Alternaria triticimaculans]